MNYVFPKLGPPRAITQRIVPRNLGTLEVWLSGLHTKPGTKSEYVIPYYAIEDPMIYVLVRVNEATESIISVLPDPDLGWRLGGHFDVRESPGLTRRLQNLILSVRLATVFS